MILDQICLFVRCQDFSAPCYTWNLIVFDNILVDSYNKVRI